VAKHTFGSASWTSPLDALTYAGDIGVDVVNMSYYNDLWLFNCLDNPAYSPAEQAEQRGVRQHPAGAQLCAPKVLTQPAGPGCPPARPGRPHRPARREVTPHALSSVLAE
jgi:hypothetical protein